MAIVHNLNPNPCLKTAGTGWFGPSGWARVAFGDPSLPRAAVWTGTLVGDIATPRFAVTPGKYYRSLIWGRTIAPSIFSTGTNWYNGGGYIGFSAGNAYNQAGDTTGAFDSGVALAPAGAVEGLLNLAGIDGEAQFTAVVNLEFDTLEAAAAFPIEYFDGDSDNASWDAGTDGTSTLNTEDQAVGLVAPLGGLTARILSVHRAGYLAALTAPLGGLSATIGLTAQISYDDTRGRIRIQVDGLVPEIIRAVVYARRAGTSKWQEIRGGRVSVVNGSFTRTVDHYEFVAGAEMEYRVVGLSTPENVTETVVQTRILRARPELDAVWLKFIPAPASNMQVHLLAETETTFSRRSRSTVYDVAGRREPVVVTDLHTARSTTVRFLTRSLAERDTLDDALSQGAPVFLHTPEGAMVPSMYATIGDYSYAPTSRYGPKHIFTVPLTEVSAPPLSVYGAGVTWQSVIDRYDTWADLIADNASWRAVAG